MKVWRRVRRVLPAFRWVALFVFVMGLGFIAAIAAGPRTGTAMRAIGLTFLQVFSKTSTGNWFPDRFVRSGLLRYDPERAQPGYTLYTVAPDLSAHLIDMNGHEVHRWFVPHDTAMPGANGPRTLFGLLEPQIEGGYLYPNGDVILIYEVKALDFPGAPLIKLDKDSHVIWRTEIQSHHSIQIVGDKIYVLTGATAASSQQQQPVDSKGVRRAVGGEQVSVLDSNGKVLSSHSIGMAMENAKNMRLIDELMLDPSFDPLHSNSLDVLTEETAHFIPGAKPGNVLLSLRNLDMLAVMDLASDRMVWALRGSWRKQHDARMLPNGHILLFDNQGGLMKHGQSRVLEIDPDTAGVVWSYDGTEDDPLNSEENRGGAQRLSNGNTLINESNAGRILEVTPDGSVVWEYVNPLQAQEHGKRIIASFGVTVSRYELPFLQFLGSEKGHAAVR